MRDPFYGICGANYGIYFSAVVWEAGIPEALQHRITEGGFHLAEQDKSKTLLGYLG